MSLLPHHVTLEPIAHKYFDVHGKEYKSVSKFLECFKEHFDAPAISLAVAKKELRIELGREPNIFEAKNRQDILLAKWLATNLDSTDTGTLIHNEIENYNKTGIVNPAFAWIPAMCNKYFPEYSAIYPEQCIYSKRFFLCGTSDLPVLRAKSKTVIDIFDYKTNKSKGIEYFSAYKKRMLGPLDHLEACSYNTYALQLSIYARMLEEHGWKIGRLAMIYILPAEPEKHFLIPVPYMKAEVELMFSWAQHYGHLTVQQNNLIPLPR